MIGQHPMCTTKSHTHPSRHIAPPHITLIRDEQKSFFFPFPNETTTTTKNSHIWKMKLCAARHECVVCISCRVAVTPIGIVQVCASSLSAFFFPKAKVIRHLRFGSLCGDWWVRWGVRSFVEEKLKFLIRWCIFIELINKLNRLYCMWHHYCEYEMAFIGTESIGKHKHHAHTFDAVVNMVLKCKNTWKQKMLDSIVIAIW